MERIVYDTQEEEEGVEPQQQCNYYNETICTRRVGQEEEGPLTHQEDCYQIQVLTGPGVS